MYNCLVHNLKPIVPTSGSHNSFRGATIWATSTRLQKYLSRQSLIYNVEPTANGKLSPVRGMSLHFETCSTLSVMGQLLTVTEMLRSTVRRFGIF